MTAGADLIEDLYPLAPMQQGILFHTLLAPGSGVYFEQLSCLVRGNFSMGPFVGAWRRLVERHTILRTAFDWEEIEEPFQVVFRRVELPVAQVDWTAVPVSHRADLLRSLLAGDRARGFDLGRAPLMRLILIREAEKEVRFVWSYHHLVLDGWSVALLWNEVFALYGAHQTGTPAALVKARPYREYIAWLKGRDLEGAERFWRRFLQGFESATPLGLARTSREPVANGAREKSFEASPVLSMAAAALARRHRITLSTFVQSAWSILLSRYSGVGDILFGLTVSGRPKDLAAAESMLGLFVNTLPVRVRVPAAAPLVSWMQETQRQQFEILEYEFSPLARVQGWSEIPPGQRLFESILVIDNYPLGKPLQVRGEAAVEDIRFFERTGYPLTIDVLPQGGLKLRFLFENGSFEAVEVERMIRHLGNLITAMVAAPQHLPLSGLSLLSAGERHQLRVEWNATDEPELESDLARRIDQWHRTAPDAIAATSGEHHLSYGALAALADRVARLLGVSEAGKDRLVALLAPRGIPLLAAILGAFRAGVAYLPLDPLHPPVRWAGLLAASGAEAALVANDLLPALQTAMRETPGIEHLRFEALEAALATGGADRTDAAVGDLPNVSPSSLAYVIYTSGSTGAPKGAMVEHRGMLNHLAAKISSLDLTAYDVVAQTASQCFDISVWQMFAPLIVGARMRIVEDEVAHDPERLLAEVHEQRVSILETVPSLLHVLLSEVERTPGVSGPASALRWMIPTGEALPPELCRRWFASCAEVPLLNAYGPTECSDDVSHHALRQAPGKGQVRVSIGRPVVNLHLHVLDRLLRSVPAGISGEICVGGVGVGRGYLRDPARTAEVFVPDPLSPEPGGRLYRTGDLGRMAPDGAMDFLGRLDFQVKIRGFRIELGEIETAIASHPGVAEVAVIAREDSPGDRRLVAYMVLHEEAESARSGLRAYLKARLPEHMVPSAFVELAELPLNRSGKLDRRALAALGAARQEVDRSRRIAPRSAVEATLAAIWAEVLRVDKVAVTDRFFELGGDSILSLQIVARAREHGISITPRQLFENDTVADLARVATSALGAFADQAPVEGPVPLTPVQLDFFALDLANPGHYNQALLLEVRTGLSVALLDQALSALIAHHDALRMRFSRIEGGWRQVSLAPGGQAPLHAIDLSVLPAGAQREALAAVCDRLQESLDIERGPILRAAWFDRGEHFTGRLLIAIHHLVVDGVSWRTLLADLESAYRQLASGAPIVLPAKTSSFQAWAEHLYELAGSSALLAELPVWLPQTDRKGGGWLDFAAEGNLEASADAALVSLAPEVTKRLLHEMPRSGIRINEALVAAVARAFAAWTDDSWLLVDLEGHGREEIGSGLDLSRTVGWFTSIFPLELPLDASADDAGTLAAVAAVLGRVPAGGIGFGLLRYLNGGVEVQPLRSAPRAQVSFNYMGQLDQAVPSSALFIPAVESAGRSRSPRQQRRYLIEIECAVAAGRLQTTFVFGRRVHSREAIETLAQAFIGALERIVDLCVADAALRVTASFPLAGLAPDDLGRLLRESPAIDDLYPVSPLQLGMLFHTLEFPGSGVYVQQLGLQLQGELDAAAFERAWQGVIERHPTLRTTFAWLGLPRPLQLVHSRVSAPWSREDWHGYEPAERERRLLSYLADDRRRGFDPTTAPLLRMALFREGDQLHRFVWSYHHLLLDGWSVPTVLNEVFALYEADRRGEMPTLAPAPLYRDYIAWVDQQNLAEAEGYWRRALSGFGSPLELPGGPPVSDDEKQGSQVGHRERRTRIAGARFAALQDLAQRQRLTVNTLLQGAWALLLAHHCGQDDVVFGAVSSGRSAPVPGIEQLVGMTISTLPVRVQVEWHAWFPDWLRRLQGDQLEARQFEYSPLVQIQGWSDVPRGRALFETLLVFENYPVDDSLLGRARGLGVVDYTVLEQTNYPVTVNVASGGHLSITLLYERERFEPATAERMLGHLEHLLEGMGRGTDEKVGDLSLLGDAERQQVVLEWSDTASAFAAGPSIPRLIARQASETPDAIAVIFEDRVLSYGELDRRARALSRRLHRLGAGIETPVALYGERSLEMVIGVLGILKAGAAYSPLDPSYPQERLKLMLEDLRCGSEPPLLLALDVHRAALPEGASRVVPLAEPVSMGEEEIGPDRELLNSIAYVIYTSGSTGRPKGVMNSHRGFLNRLLWMQWAYRLEPADRVLQKTPAGFDVSMWELLWPLLAGAALVVVRPGAHGDSGYLAGLIAERQVTTAHFVPSMLQAFLDEPAIEALCRPLLRVVCSGEALTPVVVTRFAERIGCQLENLYGPTEAAVDVTAWSCRRPLGRASVPIGRPIANTGVHIVDRQMRPVAIGVPGELLLAGAQLARGYLGRPDLTAERFIPQAFGDAPGARLYRTGDLARFQDDGNVEFLGRLDHQVKVRGFRIELGEIEVALCRHPQLRSAVVVAYEDAVGTRRLCAHLVVANPGLVPGVADLREFLQRGLPEYMIPATFLFLDELPLTPSGKLDRKALPDPARDRMASREDGFLPPRTDEETLLARLWAGILGIGRVGRRDNFFELGGDSILGLQLVSRAREAGLRLQPRQIFVHPTLEQLAAVATWEGGERRVARFVEGPIPLTPIQLRFFEHNLAVPQHWNQALMIELRQRFDSGRLRQAVEILAAHHEALRLRFSHRTEGWQQTAVGIDQKVPFAVVDHAALPAETGRQELERLAAGLQSSLDLGNGPIFRAVLFDRGKWRSQRLLWLAHHLTIDGVSWRILFGDLENAYAQISQGKPAKLPEKTTSLREWGERLIERARSPRMTAELDRWLAGESTSPALPRDGIDGENLQRDAAVHAVSLGAGETESLLTRVPEAYNTRINDPLLTALLLAVADWTGEPFALIDLEGHGREEFASDLDLTRTMGWFTVIYPVRLRLEEAASLGEILMSVKEQLRGISEGGLDYGLLRHLGADEERRLARQPQAEVLFNYLGRLDQALPEGTSFALAEESTGPLVDPRGARHYLLEVNSFVSGGRLHTTWTYCRGIHQRETIERMADGFIDHLRRLIVHCTSEGSEGFTTSDFPTARLSPDELALVLDQLEAQALEDLPR